MAVGGNKTITEVKQMFEKGEGDVYETGQMKIEEILRQWEERQRKNAAVIEEKRREAEAKAEEEKAKQETVSKDTATILSEDIQRLLSEMEAEEKEKVYKNGDEIQYALKYRLGYSCGGPLDVKQFFFGEVFALVVHVSVPFRWTELSYLYPRVGDAKRGGRSRESSSEVFAVQAS